MAALGNNEHRHHPMKKVSPFKFFNIYAFGPIGKFGPALKDDGFIRVTNDMEPKMNGKRAAWFRPCKLNAAEMRNRFPNFPGKFVELTDAQRSGHGPANPCKFTARQIEKAA
jgi:hypothetical protein